MHKPLFVVSFEDLSESRYIPTEEEVREQVQGTFDCLSPANEDEWTEENFSRVLINMFDGVTTDGKTYFVPVEAVKAYLAKKTEVVKKYIAEQPLDAGQLCRWKNRLIYGIFESGNDFIIDGAYEHETDFATILLKRSEENLETVFARIKLESIYDAHC